MSQENVEILRAVYERWGRGDFWTAEVFDPDVEVVWSTDVPDLGGTYHGLRGLEKSLREWFSAWGAMRMSADELILAADQVLVLLSTYGRGHGSGIEIVAHDFAHHWTMRNGLAIRLVGYETRAEALKAVGLEE